MNLFGLQSISMTFINEYYIALIGRHTSQGVLLTIWNIPYMVLLCEKIMYHREGINSLEHKTLSHSSKFQLRVISTVLGHQLVISYEKMIVAGSIKFPSGAPLLNMIGKGISSSISSVSYMTHKETLFLRKLVRSSEVNTSESLLSTFMDFIKGINVDAIMDTAPHSEIIPDISFDEEVSTTFL
jgi:hypothetical protein